jgi:hypothetical protein
MRGPGTRFAIRASIYRARRVIVVALICLT